MDSLTDVTILKDNSPVGGRLNYLVHEARVFASAESWMRALGVPKSRTEWFRGMLANQATLKRDFSGGALHAEYEKISVYRWHAVEWTLRAFVSQFQEHGFRTTPPTARQELERFYQQCNKLFAWGQDLQERAVISALRKDTPATVSNAPLTEGALVAVVEKAIAPRLRMHDDKLQEHDVVIEEIRESVPTLRDPDQFVTVRQAISEQALDPTAMPLYPRSRENVSGLAGQLLRDRSAERGPSVISRLDGRAVDAEMNTYRRRDIYAVLQEIGCKEQKSLTI